MRQQMIPALLVLALSACTTSPEPMEPTTHSQTSVGAALPDTVPRLPAPPSGFDPTAESRGLAISYIPSWVQTPEERLVADFVRIANTPDSRLDFAPTNAWRRATHYCSPGLADEIMHQKDSVGNGTWNREVVDHDGWISIDITNIIGNEPQAEGAPTQSGEVTYYVTFRQTYHREGQEPEREIKLRYWTVTVADDVVVDFGMDSGN